MMQPIFLITGPPGAGKTTVSKLLLSRFEKGFHLPVDDLRAMVIQGLSDSVPWTDETERQFQVAEEAACGVALTYSRHGFAVVMDHCRNLPRLNLVGEGLHGAPLHKILLLPTLERAQERNLARTNKTFDTKVLVETIAYTHQAFSEADNDGWIVLDSTSLTPEETAQMILDRVGLSGT